MKRKEYELYEDSYDKMGVVSQKTLSKHFHYHAEMILSLKGSFDAVVDGEKYRVGENTGIIVFPYQMHEYIAVDSEKALVLLLNPERNRKLYEYFKNRLPKSPIIPSELLNDEVMQAADNLMKHSKYNWLKMNTEIASLYKELIFAVILQQLEYEPIIPGQIDAMRRVLFWCQDHFTEQVTIPMASKALFISESQLSHLFSGRIHVGFREYINSLRVQAATVMLTETDKPISEIAFDCGFTSFSTFNRAFRQSLGMTPREIRKRERS